MYSTLFYIPNMYAVYDFTISSTNSYNTKSSWIITSQPTAVVIYANQTTKPEKVTIYL